MSWNLNHLELVFKVKGDSLVVGGQALLDGDEGGLGGFGRKEEKREKEERLHC